MVRPPTIFLRVNCVLPNGLHLRQEPFDEAWMSVENAAPAQLDHAVREAGWHFMWIEAACSRRGWGRTDQIAARRAITRALGQTQARFNAAELGDLHITRYPGFRVAKATLRPRHIQQRASLSMLDGLTIPQLAPK